MRYLGIDFGTKKIGLALSDEAGTMGFPHSVIENSPRLLETIRTFIAQEGVSAVVIGASLDLSGMDNPVAREAKEFGTSLHETAGVLVFSEPEWFTTQEARRAPDGGRTAGSRSTDASAAALILTSFLSHHDNRRRLAED